MAFLPAPHSREMVKVENGQMERQEEGVTQRTRAPEEDGRGKKGTWMDGMRRMKAGLGLQGRFHSHRTTLARGTGESCGTGEGASQDSSHEGKAEEGSGRAAEARRNERGARAGG